MKPQSRVVRNKRMPKPEAAPKQPAKTEADWIKQEIAEGDPLAPMVPQPDIINMVVGRPLSLAPYTREGWRIDKKPFRVSRFYIGVPGIVFDKPLTEKDEAARIKFFENTDLVYLSVGPQEALRPDDLRKRLDGLMAAKAKKAKAA